MILLRLLGRLIVISFAFFLASLAAALTATAGLYQAYGVPLTPHPGVGGLIGDLALSLVVSAMAIGHFSLMLAAVAIIVAETFSLRSWLYYAAAGAGLGGLALTAMETARGEAASRGMANLEALVFVAAGLASGLVYWVIAGRRAGQAFYRPSSRSG